MASRTQTSGGVSLATGYTWFNGRMTGMTTPSGQAIGYTYQNGRLAGITVNGNPLVEAAGMVNSIRFRPTDAENVGVAR